MQTVTDGVMEWYMEVEDPGYNSNDINPFQSPGGAGHYTQVVWAESEEIGCGFTYYKVRTHLSCMLCSDPKMFFTGGRVVQSVGFL